MNNPIREAINSEDGLDLPDSIECECGALMHTKNDQWVCAKNPEPKNDKELEALGEEVEFCASIPVDSWIDDSMDNWDSEDADFMADF